MIEEPKHLNDIKYVLSSRWYKRLELISRIERNPDAYEELLNGDLFSDEEKYFILYNLDDLSRITIPPMRFDSAFREFQKEVKVAEE